MVACADTARVSAVARATEVLGLVIFWILRIVGLNCKAIH